MEARSAASEARRFGSATVSAEPSMNAMEDASTHAASTMRRRGGTISRPSSRGHGSAPMMPRLHGSTNGWAKATSASRYHGLPDIGGSAQQQGASRRHVAAAGELMQDAHQAASAVDARRKATCSSAASSATANACAVMKT